MGTFAAYTFAAGLLLLAGYIIYKWLLAAENQPRFNRCLLLSLYLTAFTLYPAIKAINDIPTSKVAIADAALPQLLSVTFTAKAAPAWPTIVLWVYIVGMAVTLAWTLSTLVRLIRLVARGKRSRHDGYTIVRLDNDRLAPFSWGHYIVLNSSGNAGEDAMILRHEVAHIEAGHFIDLLLAQAVCIILWYNPASWLMLAELKAVHEYEADEKVLSSGTNAQQYQLLLIKKAVGSRFPSLANSLNHSKLKKRITMMYNQKTSPARRLRAIAIVPALAAALAVVNMPAVSSAMDTASASKLIQTSVSEAKGTNFSADTQTTQAAETKKQPENTASGTAPEAMPEFPGGEKSLMAYLMENVRYPESAQKANIEGLVVVSFVVGADGEVKEPSIIKSAGTALDREAVRVVMAMPKWTPGRSKGKAVDVQYSLPVNFRIPKKETKDKTTTMTNNTFVIKGNKAIEATSDTVVCLSYYVDGKKVEADGPLPTVFVNGELWTQPLNSIKTSDIEKIEIRKDLPEYPNGALYITVK